MWDVRIETKQFQFGNPSFCVHFFWKVSQSGHFSTPKKGRCISLYFASFSFVSAKICTLFSSYFVRPTKPNSSYIFSSGVNYSIRKNSFERLRFSIIKSCRLYLTNSGENATKELEVTKALPQFETAKKLPTKQKRFFA